MKIIFVHGRVLHRLTVTRTTAAQFLGQSVQAQLSGFPGSGFRGICIDNQEQPPGQVVEHRHFVGKQHDHFRCIQFIRLVLIDQALLEALDNLVAEVADQAAGKHRQFGQARRPEFFLQFRNAIEWVLDGFCANSLTVLEYRQLAAAQFVTPLARQANNGVPAPGLPAFHGLEKIGIGFIRQVDINRQRRIQVCKHRPVNGYPVMALCHQLIKRFPVHYSPFFAA